MISKLLYKSSEKLQLQTVYYATYFAKKGMAYSRSQLSEENVKTVRYQRVLLELRHFVITETNIFGCTFNHLEGKGIRILPSD